MVCMIKYVYDHSAGSISVLFVVQAEREASSTIISLPKLNDENFSNCRKSGSGTATFGTKSSEFCTYCGKTPGNLPSGSPAQDLLSFL